ncbi:MAG TPA: GNAT family N-acetyltransferase [Dongiaceae bacterium]|nr:GNAT family N-acetyltransferase [Dongiaceae bacterium]
MIREIGAEQTWLLRRDGLNPGKPLPTALDPRDTIEGARHLGWFEGDRLLGVGTISRHPLPLEPAAIAWFVRGISVVEGQRSQGIGGQILCALIAYAVSRDPGGLAWCHARIPAESFYRRHGFHLLDRIDLPEKGLRLRMARPLVL